MAVTVTLKWCLLTLTLALLVSTTETRHCTDIYSQCEQKAEEKGRLAFCQEFWSRRNCEEYCGLCGDLPPVPKMSSLCADVSHDCEDMLGMTYDDFCEDHYAVRNCRHFCRHCVIGDCAYGFEMIGDRCYMFDTAAARGPQARRICTSRNSYLLRLEDQAESDLVEDYLVNNFNNETIWRIGGFKTSDNQWYWTETEPMSSFTKWQSGVVPHQPTLVMERTAGTDTYTWRGEWWGSYTYDNPLRYAHPYICEGDKLAVECDHQPHAVDLTSLTSACSFGYMRLGQHCYKFYSTEKFQGGPAIKRCESDKAYLLRLETKEESDMIQNYLVTMFRDISSWRIGGYRNKQLKRWFWSTSQPIFCFKNWLNRKVPDLHTSILLSRQTVDSPYKWVGGWLGSYHQLPEYTYNIICESED